MTLSRRLVAEFVGTALLLAVVIGSGIMGERLAGGNVAIALLGNTLATGAGLVVLIHMFGPISGAHFNPVVTLAVLLGRQIGGRVAIGSAVLDVTRPDARCAITTHDPDTGVRDLDTLRSIMAYRGVYDGRKAIFGVLGEVAVPGRVSIGDEVRVLETVTAGERQHVAAGGV